MRILNSAGLPLGIIADEIADVEKTKHRKVQKAEFIRLETGEVRERFWFVPVDFERIRRITGYLVGSLEHFNDAKRAEERDRVKHGQEADEWTGEPSKTES